MTQSVTSFEWALVGPAQGKFLRWVQAALPLGPYASADSVVLELSVADRDAVCRLCQAPTRESGQNLRILEQSLAMVYQ